MTSYPSIIVIVGPTASGKSSLSQAIAKIIPSEIISADSRQIYKYLTIGTAKPSMQELLLTPHHFVDTLEPDQKFNAGDFQEQGRAVISKILERKKMPIITGGTGLYVKAIIDGFFDLPVISGETRQLLEKRLIQEGKELLFNELQSIDPVSSASMDATKYRRVIRALEVYYETGIPISTYHQEHTVKKMYDANFAGLNWDRQSLYSRINNRVDSMISNGFIDEVRELKRMGFDDRLQSLQTVGYREAFAFLRNEYSKERMIELMKQNTRRFAKRQMTWFRKEERIKWFDISFDAQIEEIARQIASKYQSPIQ